MTNVHDFTLNTLDGGARSLGDFKGQALLLVNVASECGLTPQYAGLQALHAELEGQGFSVLGFPCNQFGAQEPGTAAQIQTFCTKNYGVTFPLFAKLEVNGPGRAPLYAHLTQQATQPDGPGDIGWNFAKFLVGRDGRVLARFSPRTPPDHPALRAAIQAALA
jgi:glutathione peroxidase